MTPDAFAKLTRAVYLIKDAALATDGLLAEHLAAIIDELDNACLTASRQLEPGEAN